MDIRKAFKSRLLFIVTAIFLVFAATSVLAVKATNNSCSSLQNTKWQG